MSDAIDSQKLQYFGRKPSQFKTNFDSIVVAPPRCSIHSFLVDKLVIQKDYGPKFWLTAYS